MTFILGTSRLTYDYLDDWVNRQDLAAAPVIVKGDCSQPGEAVPGTFMPGEEFEEILLETEVA